MRIHLKDGEGNGNSGPARFQAGCALLVVRLFGSCEDCGDLDDALCVTRNKNEAVPSNSFSVPPLPFFPFERFHVTAERIVAHFAEVLEDEFLAIGGKFPKLLIGVFCEEDGPGHVPVVPASPIVDAESVPLPSGRSLPRRA